ncbi:hypothetical protein [Campylobacter devanensis]|uniref:hypothetical protein n=1 Tax=Campylobacter devanensis TaxID=3161138 RepID=UPI000A346963|nr:hypothetical protein [Campylobacter sp. P0139]
MAIYFIPNLDQISVPPLDVDNIPVSSEIKEVIKDALSELNSSIATNKADISRALVQLEELKNAPGGANIEEIKELISVAKDESIAKSVIDDNALKAEILPKIEGVESLVDSKLGISLYDSDKASFATKDELSAKADLSNLDNLATKDELATKLDISLYNGDKASFATKDELSAKADLSNLDNLATKDELATKLDISLYNGDKASFATKDELSLKADISNLATLATKDELATKLDTSLYNGDKASFATKDELSAKADLSNLDNLATKDELATKLDISLYNGDKASFATKDELSAKADLSNLDNLATKDELGLKADISNLATLATKDELATKLDISLYNGDKASFATKDELSAKADLSNLATLATKDDLNQYALKSEIGGGSVNGATYTQLVATMKYLGYELPSQLRAYADYNLYADDRLSGDLTIGFTPITYAGNYGQAWENVAIYNDLGEKLTAKYAQIDSSGLNIEAIFAKDIPHPKGDSWEAVPSDYALLDGEVRVSITLGAVSYYGATYGLRMLNNNPSDWSQSFLGGVPTVDEWIFTFHNYKPTKFSVTNGTHTYGSYGYMTKYNMRLSIGNWSKTLTYENSSYPNDIEIDFTNLNFGSDEKTIELAKAWNVPVTQYDINQDINNQ